LADRDKRGPYRDLADFRRRINPGPEALALLIRCGAIDFTGQPRPTLFLEADLQDKEGVRDQRSGVRSQGSGVRNQQLNLSFLSVDSSSAFDDWSPTDYALERRLRDEWAILGFILGPPMLSLFRPQLPSDLITSRELPDHVGRLVRVAGLVATGRHTPTADGRNMQFVTLEDEEGLIEVTLFPGTCPLVAYLTLGPYVVTGVVEEQYDVLTVTARSFQPMDKLHPHDAACPTMNNNLGR
jgi:DNA polymerase III alpha subunit